MGSGQDPDLIDSFVIRVSAGIRRFPFVLTDRSGQPHWGASLGSEDSRDQILLSAALRSALARGICTALLLSTAGVIIGVGSSIASAHASELVTPDPTLVQISVTEAYATWPAVPGADTYTLELWRDGTSVYSHTSPG